MRLLRCTLTAAVLAPVLALGLVVGLPSVAQAALYSDAATNSIQMGSRVGGVKCANSARWRLDTGSTTPQIMFSAKCATTGMQFGGTLRLTYYFKGTSTLVGPLPVGACNFSGTSTFAMSGTLSVTLSGAPSCNMTDLCESSVVVHDGFFDDSYGTECKPLALGEPPTVTTPTATSCAYISSVTEPTFGAPYRKVKDSFNDYFARDVTFPFVPSTNNHRYAAYVVLKTSSTGNITVAPISPNPPGSSYGIANNTPTYKTTGIAAGQSLTDVVTYGAQSTYFSHTGSTPTMNEDLAAIGYGFYRAPTDSGADTGADVPQDLSTGLIGVTDPSKCSWYWGQKVADLAGTTTDDPLTANHLPVDSPPSNDPGSVTDPGSNTGCGFSVLDPTTYASAGICELVGVLGDVVGVLKRIAGLIGDVLSAILNLADDIVSGIVSGIVSALAGILTDLFVPDDAPSFSDVPSPLPDGWLPSLPSVSAGACGPITLGSLDLGPMGGNTGTISLVDTCEHPWPLARDLIYNGLLAVVLLAAAVRAYRAVASALGIKVDDGVSVGSDDD